MNTYQKIIFFFLVSTFAISACKQKKHATTEDRKIMVLKGLYSYGPEVKSFTDCEDGREYWVADSAKTLELEYNKLGFEKPYTPVYIEVECRLIKSDTTTVTGDYDSTMVVVKLQKISKKIPEGPCNQ